MVDRISELANKSGITISGIEKSVGLSNGIIGKWRKQSPSCDKLKLVADYLNTTIDFLLTGKEKNSPTVELTADERELLDNFKKLSYDNRIRVKERAETLAELEAPATGSESFVPEDPETLFIEYSVCRVSAGTGEPLIDESHSEFIEIKRNDITEEANFAVKINGDSMMPHFKDKDIVLVRSQPTVEVGEIGIFIVDGEGYIKKEEKTV